MSTEKINKSNSSKLTIEQSLDRIKRGTIFWGIMFFVAMIVIVSVSVFYIAYLENTILEIVELINSSTDHNIAVDRSSLLSTDYLAIVIPVLVALAGAFIAFLGMNRLKMFDERIDKMRIDLVDEIEKRVKMEVQAEQARFIQEVFSKMNKVLQDIDKKAESIIKTIDEKQVHYIDASKEKANEATIKLSDIVDEGMRKINERTDDFDIRFSWLSDLVVDNDIDLNIHTIYDAHVNVERLRSEQRSGHVNLIKKIVGFVCDNDDISGDSSDYHNLAAELARGNLYFEACKVLKKGLTYFDNDMDLLADYVEYSAHIGMHDEAKDIVEKLQKNKNSWNWRCYEFVCDYYRGLGDLSTALNICSDAIKNIPDNEHGYRSKAEIQRLLTPGEMGIEAAISTLKVALDKNVNCPQCAIALADIYLGLGKYEEALSAADRAIQELAQDQPHVKVAAVFFKRASIQDRMLMSNKYDNVKKQELADNAYTDYSMALTLSDIPPIMKKQALVRQQIIEKHLSGDYVKPDQSRYGFLSQELQQIITSELLKQLIEAEQEVSEPDKRGDSLEQSF